MTIPRVLKKFRQILSRHQKIRIIELTILMVIGGFMETLSVTLILPFIKAIMDPETVMANQYVQLVCRLCGIESYRTFLVLLAMVMALLYIFKNVFLLFQLMIQNRFVYNNMFFTQQRLLRSFLLRPYEYFLEVKSGEILRVIGDDTKQGFEVLMYVLSLFSELVVSLALMITVFIIAPDIMLGLSVLLAVMVALIQSGLRPVLSKAGLTHQRTYANMQQWILQAIQGIKEVKLKRCEEYFEKNFEKEGANFVKSAYLSMTLGVIPRFMIEAVAMGVFFGVVAYMIYRGRALETLIPVLSGVAMAAVRLLPAVNRISGAMAAITYGEPAVDKLLENLRAVKEYEAAHLLDSIEEKEAGNGIIRELCHGIDFSDISYRYPNGVSDVLSNAEMRIQKGVSVGIVGVSGAGKTTAVDVLLGLLRPHAGKVLVDGTDIQMDINGWLSNIGYIPQSIFMLDASIRDNVAFGVETNAIDDALVWDALEAAALSEFVKSLPEGLDTQIGERGVRLSGGQKQRIGIARALYSNPPVLVFDEATSALDNETEAVIMDSINHLHGTKTMIIIAHRLTTIAECDMVYRVESGKIVQER